MADKKLRDFDNKSDDFHCEEIDHSEIEIVQVRRLKKQSLMLININHDFLFQNVNPDVNSWLVKDRLVLFTRRTGETPW